MTLTDKEYYADANFYSDAIAPLSKSIDFVDTKPKPFVVQVPLIDYFERIKRLKADSWQRHFCNYLQAACENRHVKGTLAEFHAEPQLGKTTILSQVFPAWKYGHDPFWREILAMYNQTRSETHSKVIIQIMRSQTHRDIFPNILGHLPKILSSEGWSTNARLDAENGRMDGQKSFSACGLVSGITGSSADGYTIDDPYKNPSEAYSPLIRTSLARLWNDGINARLTPYDCVFSMFHRYAYDDFGGFLLDTGRFDYVRYSSVCDGPYIHEATGQRFEDPLCRKEGEYISERRGDDYYRDKRSNVSTWASMFQGRPSTEEGEFFQINKIRTISGEELEQEREKCVIWVRAYDSASTAGAGDHSVGAKMGIQSDGRILVDDVKLAQVDSAGYAQMQEDTAKEDGPEVTICIPKPKSDAGSHIVFHTQQFLKGYTVVSRDVAADSAQIGSTAKHRRAYNFSTATNTGHVMFASDDNRPDDKKWIEIVKRVMRQFGLSSFDDPVDSLGDGYNYLFEQLTRGRLISNYRPQRNLFPYSAFARMFPFKTKAGKFVVKVPRAFTTYIGIKISADASLPSSAAIVVRASENTNLIETHFVIADYKAYDGDYHKLFDWVKTTLGTYCEAPGMENTTVWLHPDSAHFEQTIIEKLKVNVAVFDQDAITGYTELNWHFLPSQASHPSTLLESASRMYLLVADRQFHEATTGQGLPDLRQELVTCGFEKNGEPAKTVAVLDCLRMCVAQFTTFSTRLTDREKLHRRLTAALPPKKTNGDLRTDVSEELTVAMIEARVKREMRQEGEFVPDSPLDEEEYAGSDFSGGW